NRSSAGVHQLGEVGRIGDEATLSGPGRSTAESAMGVEDGQQGECDAGLPRCRCYTGGEFSDVRVARAVACVVQVVEFADTREAGFQHFDVSLGRDGLQIGRLHAVDEAVHHVTPGPEAVAGRTTHLGEAGHAALKGMAVQIGQAGHRNGVTLVPTRRLDPAGDSVDAAIVDDKAYVSGPAVG